MKITATSRHAVWPPLLCGLLLSATVSASSWPDVKLPEGAKAAEVTSHMIYNGTDMRGQIFVSPQSAADIVKFYRQLWGSHSVLDKIPGWQVIGHREGNFYLTVQVRADGTGSRGDIGILRIPAEKIKVELGAGVPRPSNTTVFNDIVYPDDATPARTLEMINGLSVSQNASYYREKLAATGWKPADIHTCAEGIAACLMSYQQGDRKLTVVLTSTGSHSQIVVNLVGQGVLP